MAAPKPGPKPGSGPWQGARQWSPHNSGDSSWILKGQFLKGLETGAGGEGQQPQPMQWASIGKFQNGALLWGAGEAFLI